MSDRIQKIIDMVKKLIEAVKANILPILKDKTAWDSWDKVKANASQIDGFIKEVGAMTVAAEDLICGEDGKLDEQERIDLLNELGDYLNEKIDIKKVPEFAEGFIIHFLLNSAYQKAMQFGNKNRIAAYQTAAKSIKN